MRWPVKIMIPLGFALLAHAGRRRNHQEDRHRPWPAPAGQGLRTAGAMMAHFFLRADGAADVRGPRSCFCLIGYPVAFSLSAVGLGFGAHRHQARLFRLRAAAGVARAHFRHRRRTSCCCRSRSSPSWARCWNAAAWRKTCSTPWGSCSARSAVGSPIRSFWSVRCSARSPAPWRPRSSPWA